jgi:hypothetical protein
MFSYSLDSIFSNESNTSLYGYVEVPNQASNLKLSALSFSDNTQYILNINDIGH